MSSFESEIKEWVSIDNQIKLLNERVKQLREKRNLLEGNLTKYAEKNDLYRSTIKISDGTLKFSNTKVTEPLTFKYLEKALKEIIPNETQAATILEHVKQKRQTKTVPEIKRYSTN